MTRHSILWIPECPPMLTGWQKHPVNDPCSPSVESDADDGNSRHWYLCYTKPKSELKASENLERQGYRNYVPLYRETRIVKQRMVVRTEPMFPRYLFVALDEVTDNWSPIRSTIGVSHLVRFGDRPARVSTELVNLLMERADQEGVQSAPSRSFEKGDQVRVHSGPFKDYEGIFLAKNSDERVFVLLDILGKESRLSLASDQIIGL